MRIPFASTHKRQLDKLRPLVDGVLALSASMESLTDVQLRTKTQGFRLRKSLGEESDRLLMESFAAVREASRRVLGMAHYPEQILGGLVLHQGAIAEMGTGEGKTLVATLPAYFNALTGEGVHIVTVNDYLAKRDRDLMGPVHEFLGLSVGVVLNGMTTAQRKDAYGCDITYVTNSELGFDYLRDNMALRDDQVVQRGLSYVIIDEVDSVLVDDARTPLIISGEGTRSTKLYEACDVLARRMARGEDVEELTKIERMAGMSRQESGDFAIMVKERRALLTEAGMARVERFFRIDNIADAANAHLLHHMDVALRANYLMERDKDYIVSDGQVLIVDPNTGRAMAGRRFSEGLHQALEAKERVRIRKESRTVATISYQSFFNKYQKKSGMTGTASREQKELLETYGMEVVPIPTHRPVVRIDRGDVVFRTREEKLEAVCDDVEYCRQSRRPVLVGTDSVSASEELSSLLRERSVPHNVLNAKQHALEAAIVAEAGQAGAVTIATSMAGRGTDIKLDEAARAAGGLLVIGAQRYDSRRVDGQLEGRSGRQGDPGESRFYLSLDDDLLKRFATKHLEQAFDQLRSKPGTGVSSKTLSRAIDQAQASVESEHRTQRSHLKKYDDVLNTQREVIYDQRRQVLFNDDVHGVIASLIAGLADDVEAELASLSEPERVSALLDRFGAMLSPAAVSRLKACAPCDLRDRLYHGLLERYEYVEEAFSDLTVMRSRERQVLLGVVDSHWQDHLGAMDALRDGIGLVSYAKMDPLVEYTNAASDLFDAMSRAIRADAVEALLCTGSPRRGRS